ncbi:hypothetical protein DYB28_009388 [Aphanomyces astaci]|uniref:Uncharacterized protein n=1 Tax=Aphanomyces astaci TaxID=112090 RepID=A0A9X8E4J5_APHAT|nr:hypothetical protein DYB28_009388 [Aphanomyces astaci]
MQTVSAWSNRNGGTCWLTPHNTKLSTTSHVVHPARERSRVIGLIFQFPLPINIMVQYHFVALAAAATAVTAKISVQVHRNLEVAKQSNVVVKYHCDEAHETHRRRLKAGASRSETIESLVGFVTVRLRGP